MLRAQRRDPAKAQAKCAFATNYPLANQQLRSPLILRYRMQRDKPLDAIAKRRDDLGEIGELKRLVTVLIQQIDDWPSSGILLAATNHPDLLDPAIWRRFELHLKFPLPDETAVAQFVENSLNPYLPSAKHWGGILGIVFAGHSFSDIERDLISVRRTAALENKPFVKELATFLSG